MQYRQIEAVDRILVIAAHPDDVDFGVAGSVAHWVRQGADVRYVIATDGQAGGFDPGVDRSEIPAIRREEQRRAAAVVGVSDVEFLGYIDGELTASMELRRDISRAIRRFRPDRVVCQSPERNYQRLPASHPDHLAAGTATILSVYPDARNPFAHPELAEEGMEAFVVKEVLMQAHPEFNSFTDVTETFDLKLKAILCHESQHPKPEVLGEMVKGWLSTHASDVGLSEGSLVETFYQIRL